jgi:hypothetical protein
VVLRRVRQQHRPRRDQERQQHAAGRDDADERVRSCRAWPCGVSSEAASADNRRPSVMLKMTPSSGSRGISRRKGRMSPRANARRRADHMSSGPVAGAPVE